MLYLSQHKVRRDDIEISALLNDFTLNVNLSIGIENWDIHKEKFLDKGLQWFIQVQQFASKLSGQNFATIQKPRQSGLNST